MVIFNKKMIMRKISLALMLLVLFASCEKNEVLVDIDNPTVIIPSNGVSINTVWMHESSEYTANVQVYCSGLISGAKQDISIEYEINPTIIDEYNIDITNEFAGDIQTLPSDCYKVESNTVIIPKGETYANIPITVYTNKLIEKGLTLNEFKYAIPLRLKSTNAYQLHESPNMITVIYAVVLDKPGFIFWANRSTQSQIGVRAIYSSEPTKLDYLIKSIGIPTDASYDLTIDVNPSFLSASQTLLPESAYRIEKSQITLPAGKTDVSLPISIISENIEFGKEFYLPVRIASSSKYEPNSAKNTLLLKVQVKNDYEWTYVSKITLQNTTSGRSGSWQGNKAPTSVSSDVIKLQGVAGYWIADVGIGSLYYNLKVIKTDNKNKWDVELVRIAQTPATFVLHPESYYDWDNETFHLFYKLIANGNHIVEVSEILEAQF